MKLHRLEIEGFGPFLERQRVDFDAFDADGIFLITGRTGAGKSSILDGVCFALYGSVPRYEGTEKRLRSDHCAPDDPTEVQLEFTVGDARWRVTRAPEHERPKARGTGLTTVPHAARLDELVGGEWIGRAAKPREVALLLDEIVGLSQQQFLQVILLAQNRFAQFLLARNDDRQALLRTLFGSRTYSDYQEAFEQRRRTAGEQLAGEQATVEHLLADAEGLIAEHELGGDEAGGPAADGEGDVAVRIESVDRAVQRAAYRADTRARERDEAEAAHLTAGFAHSAQVAVRETQHRRDASRTALAALEQRAPQIADDRAGLAAAGAAELLRDPIDRAEASAAAATAAITAETTARTAWTAANAGAHESHDDLSALIEQMTGDLARWADAAVKERDLAALEAHLAAAQQRVESLTAQRTVVDTRLAEYPGLIADLDRELVQQTTAAALREAAEAALTAAQQRLSAAREAEELELARRAAEQRHAGASKAAESAAAQVSALLQRRLTGYAGELAAQLIDERPCAVCGSTAHPQPAAPANDPVTDAMIDAAVADKDTAVDTERLAADAARTARAAHAEAMARAGGATAEQLAAEQASADAAVTTARIAEEHRDRLTVDRATILTAQTADTVARADLDEQLATATREVAVLGDQTTAARDIVVAARGDHDSVADRIARTTRRRDAARALVSAERTAAEAAATATAAAAERDTRIAASDFVDTAAVTAALLTADERDERAARIRDHEVALATEVDRLRELELELAGAPDEPVDVDASAAALADAKTRWTTAVDRAVRAEQTLGALRDRCTRARAAHDAIAETAAEHTLITGLADAVTGRNAKKMDLETFVLAAELEEIVAAANLRLDDMSSGRYLLRHTDAVTGRGAAGLGLEVVDAYTGRPRPPQSLSGGETFLASLALALGLAQVVTERAGGIRLDTLFIDEGFGSLDADTLELAMRTLDELRQGGRTVGVISHVETMKEQLPARMLVEAAPHGPSIIRQQAALV